MRITTLAEALKESPEFVAEHLGKLAKSEAQTFTAFNTAFAQDGVVIHVPRGEVVEAPVHIVHIADSRTRRARASIRDCSSWRSRSRRLTIVESFACTGTLGAAYLTNAVAEIEIGNGARVDHYKIQRESTDSFHVARRRCGRAATRCSHSFSYAAGAALSRTNIYTQLAGDGGEARLTGCI